MRADDQAPAPASAIPEMLASQIVHSVTRENVEWMAAHHTSHVGWDGLPVAMQHRLLEINTETLQPALALVAEALAKAAGDGAALHLRVEMLADELRHSDDVAVRNVGARLSLLLDE